MEKIVVSFFSPCQILDRFTVTVYGRCSVCPVLTKVPMAQKTTGFVLSMNEMFATGR